MGRANQRLIRDWREIRRRQAITLIRRGWRPIRVAEALGVTRGAVSQWIRSVDSGGLWTLRRVPRPGGPRKLDLRELKRIPELLWHGAEAYGFRGDLWTCPRIARVIELEFGIRYHPHHVAKLLQELEWTPHTPVVRASQRNEAEIEAWRIESWPALKKSHKREKKPVSAG